MIFIIMSYDDRLDVSKAASDAQRDRGSSRLSTTALRRQQSQNLTEDIAHAATKLSADGRCQATGGKEIYERRKYHS